MKRTILGLSVLALLVSGCTTVGASATHSVRGNVLASRSAAESPVQLTAGRETLPPFGFTESCGAAAACVPHALPVRAVLDRPLWSAPRPLLMDQRLMWSSQRSSWTSPRPFFTELAPFSAAPKLLLEKPLPEKPAAESELSRINAVNRAVNHDVRGVERVSALGGTEGWVRPSMTRSGLVGDCKNFAVEKHARLLEAGIPESRLRYAVVYRRDIGLHAVLVVRVADRDYVLDNRSPWVVPWNDAPYTWVKINEPGSGWKQVLSAENVAGRISGSSTQARVADAQAPIEMTDGLSLPA